MKRFIETYNGEEFDVVVVGDGITGAAVAYDAASRGLSVALVEKKDFGCATSAATSKLIHGGFRYLANLELGMVRESPRERRTLFNIAPNLVHPLPVLVSAYDRGLVRNKWVLRSGMVLYDLLSFDKGNTWDQSKKIGLHQALSPAEALELEAIIPEKGLEKVFLYKDCTSLFPEQLTLAFIDNVWYLFPGFFGMFRFCSGILPGFVLCPLKQLIGIESSQFSRFQSLSGEYTRFYTYNRAMGRGCGDDRRRTGAVAEGGVASHRC